MIFEINMHITWLKTWTHNLYIFVWQDSSLETQRHFKLSFDHRWKLSKCLHNEFILPVILPVYQNIKDI